MNPMAHYLQIASKLFENNQQNESALDEFLPDEFADQSLVDQDTKDKVDMAKNQLNFIEYAADEIRDFINSGHHVEEWFQNKLAKVHGEMQNLHAHIEGSQPLGEDSHIPQSNHQVSPEKINDMLMRLERLSAYAAKKMQGTLQNVVGKKSKQEWADIHVEANHLIRSLQRGEGFTNMVSAYEDAQKLLIMTKKGMFEGKAPEQKLASLEKKLKSKSESVTEGGSRSFASAAKKSDAARQRAIKKAAKEFKAHGDIKKALANHDLFASDADKVRGITNENISSGYGSYGVPTSPKATVSQTINVDGVDVYVSASGESVEELNRVLKLAGLSASSNTQELEPVEELPCGCDNNCGCDDTADVAAEIPAATSSSKPSLMSMINSKLSGSL